MATDGADAASTGGSAFLRFIPAEQRAAMVKKYGHDSTADAASTRGDDLPWRTVQAYRDERYRHCFGVDPASPDSRDSTLPVGSELCVFVDGKKADCVVQKTGRPVVSEDLALSTAYSAIHTDSYKSLRIRRDLLLKKDRPDLAESLYVLGIKDRPDLEPLLFWRLLEDGSMVDATEIYRQGVPAADAPRAAESARVAEFFGVMKSVISALFSALSGSAGFSAESAALLKLVNIALKHRSMSVERGAARPTEAGAIEKPCAVPCCQILRSAIDEVPETWNLRLKKAVYDFSRDYEPWRPLVGKEPTDLNMGVCKRHGMLLTATWYIFNQEDIWTYEMYKTLTLDVRHLPDQYQSVSEAFQNYLRKRDVAPESYKRMQLSLAIIQDWTRRIQAQIDQ